MVLHSRESAKRNNDTQLSLPLGAAAHRDRHCTSIWLAVLYSAGDILLVGAVDGVL